MKHLLLILLPKNLLSRLVGGMARWESPSFLVKSVQEWFVKRYRLNLSEAEFPLSEYKSLNALFTRRLKAGVRPIQSEVIHPCDAVISQAGPIQNGEIIQAKGWTYSVSDLIGEALPPEMEGGSFATYYLCPTDYHRVHVPVSGYLSKVTHKVGKLWPVNEWSVGTVKNLFCLNERVVFKIKTQSGPVFAVMVGATNVGQITSKHVPELRSNVGFVKQTEFDFSKDPVDLTVGDELGVFEMGSTVVMIFPKALSKQILLVPGAARLGESILKASEKVD